MVAIETEDRATVPADRPRPRLLLAQRIKPQRDCADRALLRVLGVAFAEAEIIAPVEAPIDVRFRQAQFHLRELGDPRGDVPGKNKTSGCIKRVRMRTEKTSAIRLWGWTSRWVSLRSPRAGSAAAWYGARCVGLDVVFSVDGSHGVVARPRTLQRSVRWPCKAGDRCQWCVRPTGWCCMQRVVRLTFFTR